MQVLIDKELVAWRWARYKLLDVLGIRTPGKSAPADQCHAWETLSFAGAKPLASSASQAIVDQNGRELRR